MNEARCFAGAADTAARWVERARRTAKRISARGQLLPARRPLVHHANRKVKDTTQIRWNYDLEVYECIKCHSIMYYDFRFEVCPFCQRKIVHTDERRY